MTKRSILVLSSTLVAFSLFIPLKYPRQSLSGEDAPSSDAICNEISGQSSEGAVIGQVRTRDAVLIIRTGAGGRTYSVKSRDGALLGDELNADELKASFPELTDVVEKGVAGDASVRMNNMPENKVIIRINTEK